MTADRNAKSSKPQVHHTHIKLRGYEAVIATLAALSGVTLALIELYRVVTGG